MSLKQDKVTSDKAFIGSCYSDPYMSFVKSPEDAYIHFNWGQYAGDKKKGSCNINQRALESMPKAKRERLLSLLAKAQRGG